MEMQFVHFVHTDSEIIRFRDEYKLIIFQACRNARLKQARLRRCNWEIVLNTVATKFAQGKIEYDPARGKPYSAYIYTVSKNCAKDEIKRQDPFGSQEMEDQERIVDEHTNNYVDGEGVKIIVKEAVRRLAKECRDKVKIEILLQYVINEENCGVLAEAYGVGNDYVSLVKNRWLPRLRQHTKEVLKEDENGCLNIGDFAEIGYLKPYMNW